MGKELFLDKLEWLLSDISQEEREEAILFYRSYFEEAGAENEAFVLAELGSPEKVAEAIKRDLGMVTVKEFQHTDEEKRKTDKYVEKKQQEYGNQKQSDAYERYSENNQTKADRKKKDRFLMIFICIIGILTAPGWLGIVLGIMGSMIGIAAAFVAVIAAMFVVGFVFISLGITMATSISIAPGLFFIGTGFLLLAIGLLFLVLSGFIFGRLYPWLWKTICSLWKKFLNLIKKGAEAV